MSEDVLGSAVATAGQCEGGGEFLRVDSESVKRKSTRFKQGKGEKCQAHCIGKGGGRNR